jgi:hypothetical protein
LNVGFLEFVVYSAPPAGELYRLVKEAGLMDEAGNSSRPRRPIFTIAAWFSVIVPLLAVGWACYMSSLPPGPGGENRHLNKADSVGLAVVFAVSFVAGCASLWGVKTNGVWVILPPAGIGILASAVLEGVALIFVALSNLGGP